jgi:hypothetical protein
MKDKACSRSGIALGIAGAVLCFSSAVLAQTAPAPSAKAPTGPGSISGIWTPADFDRNLFRDPKRNAIRTIEGEPPPLQPWVVQLMEKRRQDEKQGHPYAGLQSKCLPAGMPQMMFGSGLPKQTLETPGQVTMLSVELSFFRIIRLDVPHDVDAKPTLMGDSVGHWENGDLVVDTTHISDRTELGNIPHSDQLHLVERYRRTSSDRIEILMTFDDPKAFTQPWTTVAHLKLESSRHIGEYYCENNRNIAVHDTTTVVLPQDEAAQGNDAQGNDAQGNDK